MKTLFLGLWAILALSLNACTRSNEVAVTTETSASTTSSRSHTQAELKKSGESETGPALEKTEPSVSTTGR